MTDPAPEGIEYRTNEHGGQDATVHAPAAIAAAAATSPGDGPPEGMKLPPGVVWAELDDEQRAAVIEFHNRAMSLIADHGIWVLPLGGDPHPEGHKWAVVQRGSNAMLGTYLSTEAAELVGTAFARNLGVPLNVQSEDGRIVSTTTFPVPG